MNLHYGRLYIESKTQDVCLNSAHSPKGREGLSDTNYCTVSATAAAFNITWAEAHKLLASVGRKPKRGISTSCVIKKKEFAVYGVAREAKEFYTGPRDWRAGITLKTFLRQCDPSKRYLVTKSRHAFAVIGGKVRGEDCLGSRVKFIWEITPHLQRPGAINLPAIVNKNLTSVAGCEKVSA